MAYVPAPSPSPCRGPAPGWGGSSQTPKQAPTAGVHGVRPPWTSAGGPSIPRLWRGEAPSRTRLARLPQRVSRCRLPPPRLTHPGPRGAEPGGVGWGHCARLRAPPTQVGAPAPAPLTRRLPGPRTSAAAWAGSGSVLRSAAYTQGGGRVLPEVLPPPENPPSPARASTPAQVVSSPGTQTRLWGGHSLTYPPSSPTASSRVPWPGAVIPPRLPQPPARGVGAGEPAALQGGREGGAQRGALQGHLLQEPVEV